MDDETILNTIFPLSGEQCPAGQSSKTKMPNSSLRLPRVHKRLFSKTPTHPTRFGIIMTQGPTLANHQRNLLFQAAVTAASRSQRSLIITAHQWASLPLDVNVENGVHKMPNVSAENIKYLSFVYPKNQNELSAYLAAMGGSKDIWPDTIILENIEDFIFSGEAGGQIDANKREAILQKLFSLLKNLSEVIGNEKPVNILVSSRKKEIFFAGPAIEDFHLWAHEIWHLEAATENQGLKLELVTPEEGDLTYCLNFEYFATSNCYTFCSVTEEKQRKQNE